MPDHATPDTAQSPATGPSRRTVARGIAWTAPVLTGAAVAPALAASGAQRVDVAAICDGTTPAVWLAAGPGGSPPGEIRAWQSVTTYSLSEAQGATWHFDTVLPGLGLSAILTAGPWEDHQVVPPEGSASGLWEHFAVRSLMVTAPPMGPNELAGSWLGDLSSIPFDPATGEGNVMTSISLDHPLSENPWAETDRTQCQPQPPEPWIAWLSTTCDARGEGLAGLEVQASGASQQAVTVVFRLMAEDWSANPSTTVAEAILTEEVIPIVSLDATLATGSWSPISSSMHPGGYAVATRELTVTIDPMTTTAPWPTLAIAAGERLPADARVFAYITEGLGTTNNTGSLRGSTCP